MSRRITALGAAFLAILASGCARTGPEPRTVAGETYGVTREPFRDRWWQHYERGVSWSLGGFWPEAEADLRACLAQRQADSRRARTYGMHFVQCFAHRELGAVLIEQGRLDEAEREVRASLAQEPSAKADFLLERIGRLRQGKSISAPTPLARPDLVIEHVAEPDPAGGAVAGTLAVSGHVGGATTVSALAENGERRELAVNGDGAFAAALAPGERLEAKVQGAEPVVVAPIAPHAAPTLRLDGPEDGRVVADDHVFYRYDAAASGGLAELTVTCDGQPCARRALAGVQAGGTLALALAPGGHRLVFSARDAGGAAAGAERALVLAPRPAQDRRFRATALLVPLAAPADGRPLGELDDPRLAAAVQQDGRFRLVDARADQLIAREARLAEAGYVDRATAARFGRRLSARYVLTGTLRRGRGDIECFVRLVQADDGHVIAMADAYAAESDAADDAFFALVAGRLRQAFPVLEGRLRAGGEAAAVDLGKRDGVVMRMRFIAPREAADQAAGEPPIEALLEAEDVDADSTRLRVLAGRPPAVGQVVSE